MRRALAAFAVLALPVAAAGPPRPEPRTFRVDVSENLHEECMHLEKGESRRYEWHASAPVHFNIHYHRGNEVFYPVKQDNTRGKRGTFRASAADDYCWMWSSKTRAMLEGKIW